MAETSEGARDSAKASPLLDLVLWAHAAYFLVTGIWPLLHIRSFEWITGPKTDRWLVKTVGVLVTAIGAVLVTARVRKRVTPEVGELAVGSGLGLAGVELWYVARGRIRPVYLLDAVLEVIFVAGWIFGLRGRRREA